MSRRARNSLILILSLLLIAGASYLALRRGGAPEKEPETVTAQTSAYEDVNASAHGQYSSPEDTGTAQQTSAAALPSAESPRGYVLVQQWRTSSYYDLSVDREFRVEDGMGGYNIIRIKNGAVEVTEANCPDLVCVYSLPLSEPGYGGLIACMPHALYIRVVTEDEVPKDLR